MRYHYLQLASDGPVLATAEVTVNATVQRRGTALWLTMERHVALSFSLLSFVIGKEEQLMAPRRVPLVALTVEDEESGMCAVELGATWPDREPTGAPPILVVPGTLVQLKVRNHGNTPLQFVAVFVVRQF